jgi:predicted metalloprotease
MEWEGRQESQNVEDRRGIGTKVAIAGGGLGTVIVIIVALVIGVDPQQLGNTLGNGQGGPGVVQPANDPEEERLAHFTKIVFHDTEEVWDDLFHQMGKQYVKPTLVLYSGEVQSACGTEEAAVGPFYCPGDSKVYIDLSFYRDMEQKLQAPGDFAHAYVVAHEVGHHVQKLLGYTQKADEVRRTGTKLEQHHMSVRIELQADYFAGVWAHRAQEKFHYLNKSDVDSALNAAFQIGDDRLQKKARGYVVPDAFTHGTSKQRTHWFQEGFKTGDVNGAHRLFDLKYEEL